jgi:hypothetical protein
MNDDNGTNEGPEWVYPSLFRGKQDGLTRESGKVTEPPY